VFLVINVIIKLIGGFALLFATASTGLAETVYISHCLAGCPLGAAATNDLVVRNLYAISINNQSQVADWAAYRVIPGAVGVASLLPRQWQSDNLLENGLQLPDLGQEMPSASSPDQTNSEESSYRISDVMLNSEDRGRLVPMSSFAGTPYWQDLNLLSNMAALTNDMRQGPWSRMDQAINGLALDEGELFVLSGPIYQIAGLLSPEAASTSTRPSAFYKVVASRDGRVSVFVFDQDLPPHVRFCDQRLELDQVEQMTGLDFFPQQPLWPMASLDQHLGC